jgi:hypothetical protein
MSGPLAIASESLQLMLAGVIRGGIVYAKHPQDKQLQQDSLGSFGGAEIGTGALRSKMFRD